MEMLSDEQLMVGVLSGETRALSLLVERHYGPLPGESAFLRSRWVSNPGGVVT